MGSGQAAAGGVRGCPKNLGVAARAGVKMRPKSSAGGLYGSAARNWRVPSGCTSTRGTCDLPLSAAVGLLPAVGAAECLLLGPYLLLCLSCALLMLLCTAMRATWIGSIAYKVTKLHQSG